MDKYIQREQRSPHEQPKDSEVKITAHGKMRNFISYITTLLLEKGETEVTLKGMGKAISKAVSIAEIVKRRIPGLHQTTTIGSKDIVVFWEPIEEGLDTIETVRHISTITIMLSTIEQDPSAPGYQPPLPESEVSPVVLTKGRASRDTSGRSMYKPYRGRGRGRGRGGRGRGTRGRYYRGYAKRGGGRGYAKRGYISSRPRGL